VRHGSYELEDLEEESGTRNPRIGPSSDNESRFSPLDTCPERWTERFRRRSELAETSYRAAVELKCLAASVVLHADPWHGKNFTDHFQLLNIDGSWKIMSKIYSER
jgi:hypothetical protein